MRPVLLFLLGSISVFAQPFSAGIKAGVPLTDFLTVTDNGGYTVSTQRYIIGGVAELRLPLGFGVEFDALYRRLHYDGFGLYAIPVANTRAINVFTASRTTGINWEFPLLLKYRFHFPAVRPYLDAGAAWDTLAGLKQTNQIVLAPLTSTTSSPSQLKKNGTIGFVAGGGVDIRAMFLHISPEIRFTRWNSAQIVDPQGLLHSNLNQAEVLVGFTF